MNPLSRGTMGASLKIAISDDHDHDDDYDDDDDYYYYYYSSIIIVVVVAVYEQKIILAKILKICQITPTILA